MSGSIHHITVISAFIILCSYSIISCSRPEDGLTPATVVTYEKNLPADREIHPVTDSLLNRIYGLEGEEKLKAMEELVDISKNYVGTAQVRKYTDMLSEEARTQKSLYYESAANKNMVYLYYYQFDTDSIYIFGKPAAAFAVQNGFYDHYFQIMMNMAMRYGYSGRHEEAIAIYDELYQVAQTLGDPVYMSRTLLGMGVAYQQMGEWEQAVRSHKESAGVLHGASDSGNIMFPSIYENIAKNLVQVGEYRDAIVYADSVGLYYERHGRNPRSDLMLFTAENYAAEAYLRLDELDNAAERINNAEKLLRAGWPENNVQYLNRVRFDYYRRRADYAKSLEYVEELKKYYISNNLEKAEVDLLWDEGRILYDHGRYDAAAQAFFNYGRRYRQLAEKQHAEKLSALRTRYDVDKLEMQSRQDRLKLRLSRNYIYGLAAIILLLVIIITVIFVNSRRLRARNRSLYDRLAERDRMADELKELRPEYTVTKSSGETEHGELFRRIAAFMDTNPVYTDTDITRKKLAEYLGTNEKYLREAIKEATGMTVNEYINNLRLERARRFIMDPDGKLSVDEVVSLSGFGSRNTFYRLFKERYGITPNQLKQAAGKK